MKERKRPMNYFTSILLLGIVVGLLLIGLGFCSAFVSSNQLDIGDVKGYSILAILIFPVFFVSKFFITLLLSLLPIADFCLMFLLLGLARLFQLGTYKKWKRIISTVLIIMEEIIKLLFVGHILFMCYLFIDTGAVMLLFLLIVQAVLSLLQVIAFAILLKKIKKNLSTFNDY